MVDAKNLGSPFGMKTATTVWMGQHQKFDFILNDLNFEKNRLCTGLQLSWRTQWHNLELFLVKLPQIVTPWGQPQMAHLFLSNHFRYDEKCSDQV